MKILTINTHSLLEEDYERKCKIFAEAVNDMKADILLMQEVNQTSSKDIAYSPHGLATGKVRLKKDNHALHLAELFEKYGNPYRFVWIGIKSCYGKYDEGLAIMSKNPIENAKEIVISQNDDFDNWKTRKALLAKTCGLWVCNTHMGWWEDEEEPFMPQFEKLHKSLKNYDDIFLGGDFNSPDTDKGKGYDYVISKGWQDTYSDAVKKDGYATIKGNIAGWENNSEGIRIDYIFSKKKKHIKNHCTVFNSQRYGIISDHFGVISEF